jgi:hypothetical protein
VSDHDQFDQAALTRLRQGLHVTSEHGFEWLLLVPLRMLGCKGNDAIDREGELRVHGVLDPQCAVVVEGRDALGRRDEIGRPLSRHGGDELQDRLLCATVIPRRQRVACLGLRRHAGWQGMENRQRRQGRKYNAAGNPR